MKIKFVTIKKAHCAVLLCIVLLIAVFCGVYFPVKATSSPKPLHTIVIDAGHGGKDGGAVGKTTGITESELNLKYALKLKEIAQQFGFRVVLTRSDMNGLYSPLASNKKRSEMEKRKEIIKKNSPDIVVSLHMNSFPNASANGSQVFYAEDSVSGQALAQSVQQSLFKNVQNAHKNAKIGDFYVLNCSENPSILVECGFLSNAEEEAKLQEEKYIQDFCYHLFCGILMYLNFS